MADRFWVGNGGNINDTAHWSLTSGGAGGASVPTSTENAKFDALSFTLPGQIVTINATFGCLDMIWTGATNNPTLAGASLINPEGTVTFIAAMTHTYTGAISFRATSTGKTFTTGGNTLLCSITFNGVGGGWTLQDDLKAASVNIANGTFNSNNKNITLTGNFDYANSNIRTVTLGSSVITISGSWNATTTTNLTYTANTAAIIMLGTAKTFNGGGLTYYSLSISGVATTNTISGANTITTLKITEGNIVNFPISIIQTVTNLLLNGTLANPITLRTATGGTTATISLPAGRYFIRHASIRDITITGATSVTSIAGTNVSGNTGITFVTKFEMGRIKNDGSFNWYSSSTGTVDKVSG